mmetsp:Transcript_47991/g.124629  ORF Transcript_47991/g.124629 Transcript_47991/m.124629 type:complete len:528 (-) Transcript_47991:352-1935(-)
MIKLPAVADEVKRRRPPNPPAAPMEERSTESKRLFRRPIKPSKLSMMKRKTNSMPMLSLEMPYESRVLQTTRSSSVEDEYVPRLSMNFQKVFKESGIAEKVKPLSARTFSEDRFRSSALFDEMDLLSSIGMGEGLSVAALEKAFTFLEKLASASPAHHNVMLHVINLFRKAIFSDFYTTDESGAIALVPYYEIAMKVEEEKDLLKESEVNLRQSVVTLTENLDKMESMNEQYKSLLLSKEGEVEELQATMKDADSEISMLKLDNARLTEKLDIQMHSSHELGARVSELSEKLLVRDREVDSLRKENEKMRDIMEKLQAKLEEESAKFLEVSSEAAETRRRLEENHAREVKYLGRTLMEKEKAYEKLERDFLEIEQRTKAVSSAKLELETRQRSMTPRPDWRKLKQIAPMVIRPDIKSTSEIVKGLCAELDGKNYYGPLQQLMGDGPGGKGGQAGKGGAERKGSGQVSQKGSSPKGKGSSGGQGPTDEDMLNFVGGASRKHKPGEVDMYVAAVKRKHEMKKSKAGGQE